MWENPSKMLANLTAEFANPISDKATRNATWSRASVVSSSVKDADLVALRAQIQKLQTENEDLMACHAANQKTQIDKLLKLCGEKEKSGALKADAKRLAQQLEDVRAAQEKSFLGRQATKDAVAAKDSAEM